ncbi:MAG: hypothetical protein ABL952_15650, partial [Pyrinomonadaceae bacterium]
AARQGGRSVSMSKTAAVEAVTSEPVEVEETEQPISATEMFQYLVQDLVSDGDPAALAGDVIDNFVLIEQPESGQILSLLETDTPMLIQLLKAFMSKGLEESLAAVDRNGPRFIDAVKISLKEQLSEIAAGGGE